MTEISVKLPLIIVNWNGTEDTIECLNSLEESTFKDFRVYLIDNNSDSENRNKLIAFAQNKPYVELILNSKNLGFAKAHNKIWEERLQFEDTEYIALLNNDTAIDPNWLEALITTAKDSKADIAASKMINYWHRNKMDNAGHRMLNTGEIIPIGHNKEVEQYTAELSNLGACAGACLYSTKMLKDIGFFDPVFTTGYEDAELGLRAVVTGHKSIYVPDAIVYHKMGQSIKNIFNEEYSLMIHTSILYSYFKCMPFLNIVLAFPSFLIKYISMFVIDIIFWRPKFLRVLLKSWRNIFNNYGNLKQRRKALKSKRIKYLKHPQKISFFFFDVKRFWDFIILKKKSAIDNY